MEARLAPIPARREELGLRELVQILYGKRWLILATVLFCTGAAVVAALAMPSEYEASTVLASSNGQANSSGLASLGSSLSALGGGLASLAGISLSGNEEKAEAVATLQSQELTERYIAQQRLIPVLFPQGRAGSPLPWGDHTPTLWKAAQLFSRKVRGVREDPRSGLITLTIKWTNPQLAAKWANGLVSMTNDYLRGKAITESDRDIAYLNKQVNLTSSLELRSALYSLMESEIKKEMLAKGNDEYALKVIDPALPPEKRSSPNVPLWVIAGFLFGLFLSFVLVSASVAWDLSASS